MPGTNVLSAEVLEYPSLWNRNHAGRSSFHHLALSRGLGRGRLCLRVSESDVRLIAKDGARIALQQKVDVFMPKEQQDQKQNKL